MRINNNYDRCLQIGQNADVVRHNTKRTAISSDMENAMKMCELFQG